MTTTLISNATVVTVDASLGVLRDTDVLIEDELIAEVRPGIEASADRVIDGSDFILMPGLINAHIHTWETVLRGTDGRSRVRHRSRRPWLVMMPKSA